MNDIMSEKIDAVSKALVAAKKEIRPIFKDTKNPFFKTKYAGLSSVIEATDQALSDNGLLLFQCVGNENEKSVLFTTLTHVESGQWIRSSAPLLNTKGDSQGLGSAITYMRRYSILALLGICADEDDDGNKACEQKKQEAAKPLPPETEIQRDNVLQDFIRENRFDDKDHYSIRAFLLAHCKKFEKRMSQAVIDYKDKVKLFKHVNQWSDSQKSKAVA